jgi:hypothetical protein
MDGVAPGAVIKVTLYSKGWFGHMCDVHHVEQMGPTTVAQVQSVWTEELVRIPVNHLSVELVAPPVSAGEASHGA